MVSEQKEEGWAPKVGSKVFVPRLGGDAKVGALLHVVKILLKNGQHSCMQQRSALWRAALWRRNTCAP